MASLVSLVPAYAQYDIEQHLSVGDILVANEKLGDPNFAEAVVLLVQFDASEGTVGLVINRRSEIPLSRIFPDVKHATADPIYMGGPVGITIGQALLRLPGKAEELEHVSGDVYATADKELIEKSVSSRAQPSKFRLYFGYAGWAPGQLEAEIRLGAWAVLKGRSKVVFDSDPDSLWDRLIRESRTRMAGGNQLLHGLQIQKIRPEQLAGSIEIKGIMNPRKACARMTTFQHQISGNELLASAGRLNFPDAAHAAAIIGP